MKSKIDIKLMSTLVGGLIFTFLFWEEGQALNLLIYTLFITTIVLSDRQIPKTRTLLFTGCAHLFAAALVVINASDLSVITWYISLSIFVGFLHFQALRSIFAALAAALLQAFTAPVNIFRKLIGASFDRFSFSPFLKLLKYIVLPFFVLVIFSVLYSNANPVFARYQYLLTSNISLFFSNIFDVIFSDLSFARFMHLVLGILVSGAVFIGFRDKALEAAELACNEQLERKKRNGKYPGIGYEIAAVFAGKLMNRMMALKTENTIGILCFVILNLLLLFLNLIDIGTLWQGSSVFPADKNFSAELHDGTNALIISIVMAMLVIIYFFNGNLNFYSRNKTLRLLAYIWIIQNSFLVASVWLRDYQYIAAHGLTYKRIGVLIFLLLCAIGLATVYIKVARQKTAFYLLKVNTFIWYSLLLCFGLVNWDVFIADYNIRNRNEIRLDLDHLKSLSDKTLPLLLEHRDTFKVQDPGFEKSIENRVVRFKKERTENSILSWNYRDWQTLQYLIDHHL